MFDPKELSFATDATKAPIITPEIASDWLETRNKNNRAIAPRVVARYAEDMRNGNWHLNSDTISFDENGYLVNGQHRLAAIVQSGVAVKISVAINAVALGLDVGRKRDFADTMRMVEGIDWVTSTEVAIARQMILVGMSLSDHNTYDNVKSFCLRHKDAIQFAKSSITRHGKTTGIANAIVWGTVACAYYYVERSALERFCKALSTGMTADVTESAAVRLRDRLLQSNKDSNRGSSGRKSQALLICSSICHFESKNPVTLLRPTKEFKFNIEDIDRSRKANDQTKAAIARFLNS